MSEPELKGSAEWCVWAYHRIAALEAETEILAMAVANRDKSITALEKVAEALMETKTDDPIAYMNAMEKVNNALRAAGYLSRRRK